jgi:hypothetical protein
MIFLIAKMISVQLPDRMHLQVPVVLQTSEGQSSSALEESSLLELADIQPPTGQ